MEATYKWHILLGLPKWSPEIVLAGLLELWTAITPDCIVWLRQGLNQSCSPRRDLFNAMSHSRIWHREEVDSRLLVVGSQIASLTPDLSFAHNLGCKCPNDQWEVILDIYVSRPFQWHQEHPNARCFSPCYRALNIRESRRTSNPNFSKCWVSPPHLAKVGVRHLILHSICYLYLVVAFIIHNVPTFCTTNEKIWITSFTTIGKNIGTIPANFNDLLRKFVVQITWCVVGHHNHFANCEAFGEIFLLCLEGTLYLGISLVAKSLVIKMSCIGKDLMLLGGIMFLNSLEVGVRTLPFPIHEGLCIFRSCTKISKPTFHVTHNNWIPIHTPNWLAFRNCHLKPSLKSTSAVFFLFICLLFFLR